MRDWIRKLLGVTDLQATVTKLADHISEEKIKYDSSANKSIKVLQTLLVEVQNTIPSGLISVQKDIEGLHSKITQIDHQNSLAQTQSAKILDELNGKLGNILPKSLPSTKLDAFFLDFGNKLKFESVDVSKISAQDLIPVAANDSKSGIFSSILSGAIYGQTVRYSSEGFFKATANVNDLIKYADGSYASIVKGSKGFGSHSGFNPAGAAALWPVIALQLATIITSQQHMQQIGKQLKEIKAKLIDLAAFHKNERISQLQYMNERLQVYQNRKYFTIEDFVLFESFKYDLSKIEGECLAYYIKKMQELSIKYNLSNSLEIMSYSESEGMIKRFKNVANSFTSATKEFFQNSTGKVSEFIQEFRDADLFAYAEITIAAEKLYDAFLYQEIVANMSVKNFDADRCGKLEELIDEFGTTQHAEKKSMEIRNIFFNFKEALNIFVEKKKGEAFQKVFVKNKDIIDQKILDFNKDYELLESLLNINADSSSQENLVKALNYDFEIIIENNGEREEIYTRKINC